MLTVSFCTRLIILGLLVPSFAHAEGPAEVPDAQAVQAEEAAVQEAEAQQADVSWPFDFQLQIHGFVSQGYIRSTENNYLVRSKRGSFEFSEAGINFNVQLASNFRVALQLFTRDLGVLGNYAARFDWFQLDYRWRDWLGVRAGRVKLPFGLYNDISDIDAARVPILLPQSVYPTSSRDYLLALTGVELYGYLTLGGAGALDYRAYYGTIYINLNESTTAGLEVEAVRVPYVGGGRLLWTTPLEGLRVGGSVQALRIDMDFTLDAQTIAILEATGAASFPAGFDGRIRYLLPVLLWVASAEYVSGDLLLAAEYSRWSSKLETRPKGIIGTDVSDVTSERGYVMGSYRVSPWLVPGAYYSVERPNAEKRSGVRNVQHDTALTLRFDIFPFWLLKLEGHYMNGTAVLQAAENPNPKSDWFLFLAKTTAYF